MKIAITYPRISTDTDKQANSLDAQRHAFAVYAMQNEMVIQQEFEEQYSSKAGFDRPAFNRMLKYLKANKGKVHAVLVNEIDRFGRSGVGDFLEAEKEITKTGAKVIFLDHQHEGGAYDIIKYIKIWKAKDENDGKAKKVRETMQNMLRIGQFPHKPPIGYERKWIKGKPSLQPSQQLKEHRKTKEQKPAAEIIREAFRIRLTGGNNADCMFYLRMWGFGMSKSNIKRFLTNEVYTTRLVCPENNTEAWQHDTIIHRTTFDAVHGVLNGKRARKEIVLDDNYHLQGLLVCSCGQLMVKDRAKSRHGYYVKYYKNGGRCTCGRVERVNVDKIDQQIIDILGTIRINPALMPFVYDCMIHEHELQTGVERNEIKYIKAEIAKKQAQLDRLKNDYLNQVIDGATYSELRNGVSVEVAAMEVKLAELDKLTNDFNLPLNTDWSWLNNIVTVYKTGNYVIKKAIVGSFFEEKITIFEKTAKNPRVNVICKELMRVDKGLNVIGSAKGSASLAKYPLVPQAGAQSEPLQAKVTAFSRLVNLANILSEYKTAI